MKNYKIEIVTEGSSDAQILLKMQKIVELLKKNGFNVPDKLVVSDFDGNLINPEFHMNF